MKDVSPVKEKVPGQTGNKMFGTGNKGFYNLGKNEQGASMPATKNAAKTNRGHVGYTRTSKTGKLEVINAKAGAKKTPAKKQVSKKTKSAKPKFSPGDDIYFKRPGEDQRTRKGTLKRKGRTGWTIEARPDGTRANGDMLYVPEEHIRTAKEFEASKKKKGTRTATSEKKRVVSVAESNRRAKVAEKRFPLTEEQVIAHPKVQDMMTKTISSLASKNLIDRGNIKPHSGIKFSADSIEYNDLVSDYLTAAANAFRREASSASKAELDTFKAFLAGEESGSRIFMTITMEGRGAVMGQLKQRAKRIRELTDFQDVENDPAMRRKFATALTDNRRYHDDNFSFTFDAGDKPHLHGMDRVYDPTGADPYEEVRYREALIEHHVSKLDPAQRAVIERKYALDEHMQPKTNDVIAKEVKAKKIPYPNKDRDWNRQSVTAVHDQAIESLRKMDNIEDLKRFWRALGDHLTLIKSHGRIKPIAPGITGHSHAGKTCVAFNPRLIAKAQTGDLAKSYSSDLAKQYPGGRWITISDHSSPLHGRHIFILPHKDGSASVLAGGGEAMRHKLLQPKSKEKDKGSGAEQQEKPVEKKAKKELSPEQREQIESARIARKEDIRHERKQMAEIVRQHLGKEVEITDKDRAEIEKKVENIADPKAKATERLRETWKVKKERDSAMGEVLQMAKQAVVNEEPSATAQDGETQPTVAAVVKEHAEDLLNHYYKIKALERENKELGKALKTNTIKMPVGDRVNFDPLSADDLKKTILDESLRQKELANHYKLVASVRGYVDDQGNEVKAKGGGVVERNVGTGGYEAITGLVGEMTGNSIMTKEMYDQIGAKGAAVLAHYYLSNSGIGGGEIGKRLEKDLGEIGSAIAARAVRKGDEFMDMAQKVKESGYGTDHLMEAAQARGAALKYVNKAYETYAQAQGALNQSAELAYAAASNGGRIEITAGTKSGIESKRRKMGLNKGDVKIERTDNAYTLTVKPAAYEKLIHEGGTTKTGGVAGEGYTAEDIKAHRANTDNFHPQGIREFTPANKEGVATAIKINPHQQAAVRFIEKQKRVYLNYEAGTGKSLSIIAAKAHIDEQKGAPQKMIVSMPGAGGVLLKNFGKEVEKFSDYKVAVIEAKDSPEVRRQKYNSGPDTIVVVNHEKMNFDGKMIKDAGFNIVAADEAHTITQREGGQKSGKSEGLKNVARSAEHYVAMSGTPTPSDLSQLYFHANLMNPERFNSQKEFMAKYGNMHKGEGMKEKISSFMNNELADHVITAKKGTLLKPDGKPVEMRVQTHLAQLTPAQREQYRQTVKDYKDGKLKTFQVENRMKSTLNDTHHADNGKFDEIKKIIDHHMATKGPTEKLSLYVNSYAGADNIHDFLEKHYPGNGIVRFANKDRKKPGEKEGRNYTAAEKSGFIDKFKHDNNVRFGIHTMAGTTGLNVQHDGNGGGATTVVALASGEAGYSTIDQFFSRAYRTGANRDVDAHMVLTDTPYDLGTKVRLDERKAVGDMIKAHIHGHIRRTKSGVLAQVREHDDRRKKALAHHGPATKAQIDQAQKDIAAIRDSAHGLRESKRTTKNGKTTIASAPDYAIAASDHLMRMANDIEDHWHPALFPDEYSQQDMDDAKKIGLPHSDGGTDGVLRFTDRENGVEAHIAEYHKGGFSVAIKDLDSGNFFPSAKVYKTKDLAIAAARAAVGKA